jgi:hypothetical protein
LYIHFFGLNPDASRTQYLTHRCTRQFRLCSVSTTVSLVHTKHAPSQSPLLVSPRISYLLRCWTLAYIVWFHFSDVGRSFRRCCLPLSLSRMYEKSLVVEYTWMGYLFLAQHLPGNCPFKLASWKLWRQRHHRVHTARCCGFPLQYAEIEYYFFYIFMNIIEAVILYLPECKTILIFDNLLQKKRVCRGKMYLSKN